MKIVAVRMLALAALGTLLTGCAAPPYSYIPPSPQTQADQACNYLGQGPGTPGYRTCYSRALGQFETPRLR